MKILFSRIIKCIIIKPYQYNYFISFDQNRYYNLPRFNLKQSIIMKRNNECQTGANKDCLDKTIERKNQVFSVKIIGSPFIINVMSSSCLHLS